MPDQPVQGAEQAPQPPFKERLIGTINEYFAARHQAEVNWGEPRVLPFREKRQSAWGTIVDLVANEVMAAQTNDDARRTLDDSQLTILDEGRKGHGYGEWTDQEQGEFMKDVALKIAEISRQGRR